MKLYVHSARSWEKRARCSAPLSSCHYIVFHNVIWNWCNCAMQFLNIIVLSCPLQPCSAHVYDTCACTVDLVLSCTFTNSMNIRASQKVWRCRALSHYCPRIVPADRPSIFSQYAKIRKHVGTRSRLSSIIFTSRKLERTCEIFRYVIILLEIMCSALNVIIGQINFFSISICSLQKFHNFCYGASWLGNHGDYSFNAIIKPRASHVYTPVTIGALKWHYSRSVLTEQLDFPHSRNASWNSVSSSCEFRSVTLFRLYIPANTISF